MAAKCSQSQTVRLCNPLKLDGGQGRNRTADASLFRTPLLSIYKALQAAEERLSTTKFS